MPSPILILFFAVIVGGIAGWARHHAKRRRRDSRIPTQHGEQSKKILTEEGGILVGETFWQPPRIGNVDDTMLQPAEAAYLILWFRDMTKASSFAIRRGIRNNGWLTLPIPLCNGTITEARRMEGNPHRWVLSSPGIHSSAMRLIVEIAKDTWVLDEKFQYTLEHTPLQCLVEFGTERGLWLSASTGEHQDQNQDNEDTHSS